MFNSIVVGYDSSDQARDAVALAQALAGPETKLTVCSVYAYEISRGRVPVRADEIGPVAQARGWLDDARELLAERDGVEFRMIGAMSAAAGLHAIAERTDADLLVVGSSHRGAVGRLVPGSVTEQTLHAAPCPVAAAPAGLREHDYALRRIGIAYDGRAESTLALRRAVELAQARDATLEIVWVIPIIAGSGASTLASTEYVQSRRDTINEHLDELVSKLGDALVEPRVIVGDPAQELAAATKSLDLLVMGSRGYGPLRSLLLGSVSGKVARAATSPVLVFPRGAEPGDAVEEPSEESSIAS